MGAAKSTGRLFQRYAWLAGTITDASRTGGITFDEISHKWERSSLNDSGEPLPIKTFYNHQQAISDMFSICIVCDRHNGFRYRVETFDEDRDIEGLRRWMLSSIALNDVVSESRDMRDRILLESAPINGMEHLSVIIEAMRSSHTLHLVHKGFNKEQEKAIEIEPYCLKNNKQRWYVLGRYVDSGLLHPFGLDRILCCRPTENRFVFPEDFSPEGYFSEYYGTFVSDKVGLETIRLKFFKPILNYVRSLPLHHSQREIESADDYSVMEYRIRPTKDFINEIVSKGGYCKVLSPQSVIDLVNEEYSRMAQYQK